MASNSANQSEVKFQKLVVFGATGRTGRQLLKQAVEIGHNVIAIARNPEDLADFQKYENFDVKKGNVLDRNTFQNQMVNADAVMSCLGPSRYVSPFQTITFYTDGMKEIHEAMKANGISRLVVNTSWATQDRSDLPFFIRWILRPLLIRSYLVNMDEMEQYLTKTDLNYTVCRPAGLTDDPPSGKKILVVEDGQHVPDAIMKIPRADVSLFMLKCLQTQDFDRKLLAIGIK